MATESQIETILNNPLDYDGWTIQGLGMVRLDLDPPHNTERLHIWTPDAVLNDGVVSAHDHPWRIKESRIVLGVMRNMRFKIDEEHGVPSRIAKVVCGIGSHLEGPVKLTGLANDGPQEVYTPGDTYSLSEYDLHESRPDPGTVTVMSRTSLDEPKEVSIVWQGKGNWRQEGFTRHATSQEVVAAVSIALALRDSQQT